MPNSIINFIQEIGRCGRNRRSIQQGNIANDWCVLIFELKDFVYMEQRIRGSDHCVDIMELHLVELYKMLSMISLQLGCWHVQLEKECHNQQDEASMNHDIVSCLNTCPHCDGSWVTLYWPIIKEGLIRFLFFTMVIGDNKAVHPSELGTLLYNYVNVGPLVYGKKAAKPSRKIICDNTILSLIAATILGINTKFDESNSATTTCHFMYDDENGIPKLRYELDVYWEHIPLIYL